MCDNCPVRVPILIMVQYVLAAVCACLCFSEGVRPVLLLCHLLGHRRGDVHLQPWRHRGLKEALNDCLHFCLKYHVISMGVAHFLNDR